MGERKRKPGLFKQRYLLPEKLKNESQELILDVSSLGSLFTDIREGNEDGGDGEDGGDCDGEDGDKDEDGDDGGLWRW